MNQFLRPMPVARLIHQTCLATAIGLTVGVLGQDATPATPPAQIVAGLSAGAIQGQRPITLREAIDMALVENFSIQRTKLGMTYSGYLLSASYGLYDPVIGVQGDYELRTQAGGTDSQGVPLPSTEIETFGFSGSPLIGGTLPWGMDYRIANSFTDRTFTGVGGSAEQYRSDVSFQLVQPLLRDFWIDGQRAQIQVNKKQIKVSEWEYKQQVINTVTAVEQAYYDLIFLRENITVQKTAYELASQLLRENKKKVEVGAMAPLDEKQAESRVASSQAALIAAEQSYVVAQNNLKNLISARFVDMLDVDLTPVETLVAVPADASLSASWEKGLAMRPELQIQRIEMEKQDIRLRLAKNQVLPTLDAIGTYGRSGLSPISIGRAWDDIQDDKNPVYSAAIRLSIPIGNISARNQLKASRNQKEQMVLSYKSLEQFAMMEINNAVTTLRSELQRVEATRQARAFAQEALNVEQKKLENGKSTSFFVLQYQNDLTQRRYDEIQALASYNKALANLAKVEGTTFERHNIKLDFQ